MKSLLFAIAIVWTISGSAFALGPDTDGAPGPAEEHFRVLRTGGMSPFQSVEWSVVVLAGTPLARERKTLANYTENIGSMRLLTHEEYANLWKEVDALGPLMLPEESPETKRGGRREDGGTRFRVEMARGGETNLWVIDVDPGTPKHSPLIQAIGLLRGMVGKYTEKLPFRNVFYDPGEVGFLDLDSNPGAKIWIDGQKTGLRTPLYTYELPEGKHEVRLVSDDGIYDRSYPFRIQAGMTTVLRLDLR